MKNPKRTGRWKPGESGNPKGRPVQVGKIASMRELITAQVPAIVARLTAAALGGDVMAARTLLERAIPPVKAAELACAIALPASDNLVDQGRAVVRAVAAGELATGQGVALVTALGTLARLVESQELRVRIEALEAAAKDAAG